MRDKKMAKRIAVAILAAATTFSSVPATAVFAAETSVEASDMTVNSAETKGWTITGKDGVAKSSTDFTTAEQSSEEYTIGNALSTADTTKANSDDTVKSVLQSVLTAAQGNSVWTVQSTDLYSKKGNGTVVVLTSSGKTLTYTFTTSETGTMLDDEINALDSLFEGISAITYDGNTINTATVQSAFNSAKSKSTDTFFTGTAKDYTYTVKTATVADGTVTGTLQRTNSDGKILSYTYTAKATQNSDTKKATVKQALATIEATTYPQPANATDGTDNDTLKNKIQSDLDTALDGTATAKLGSGTVDLATRTSEGSYNASVDNNNVNVTLKYSSDSKLNDAKTLAEKTTLKAAKSADTLYSLKVDNTAGTAYAANTDVKDDAGETTGKVEAIKLFSSTSAFSRALQPTTATEAVDSDDVKDAVLKLFTDAADNAKYTGDGVTYTAEAVKFGDAATDTDDKTKDATISTEGQYLIKVTATIDNDFYGWTVNKAEEKNATSTATWYVEVKTPKLKEVKNTAISFADKKVVYSENAYTSTDKNGKTVVGDLMKIDLGAVLTPADSNSNITYSIVTNDKTNAGVLGDGSTSYYSKLGADGAVVASSKYISKNSELYVPGAGTYKVRATANGKIATATITVLSKFNDVRPGAFYETAVNTAYAKGVTSGKTTDTFGVNDSVTRAQFITWLYKLAVANDSTQAIADADVKVQFADVPTDKFYAKAVQWAVANGITSGTSTTTFSPNADITRAQAVTMLWKYVGQEDTGAAGSEDDYTKRFTDLPSNKTFAAAITWAVNNGITSGTTLTTFSPNATATRAQAITFIYNYTGNTKTKGALFN